MRLSTRMVNSAAGASLARDCVICRSANAEFVPVLVRSPRRNDVNRSRRLFAVSLFWCSDDRESSVWRVYGRAQTPVHQFVFIAAFRFGCDSLSRFAVAEQKMALAIEQMPPCTKCDDVQLA